jgi:hypothetical protein
MTKLALYATEALTAVLIVGAVYAFTLFFFAATP